MEELMVMQRTLRPYATAGVALVGASLIAAAVTSVPAPSPPVPVVHTPVQLTTGGADPAADPYIGIENDLVTLDKDLISGFSSLDTGLSTIEADLGPGGTIDTDLTNVYQALVGPATMGQPDSLAIYFSEADNYLNYIVQDLTIMCGSGCPDPFI
jgi:hypothetical protein